MENSNMPRPRLAVFLLGLLCPMFLSPMWDNEVQRVGKQRCTPFGYSLHIIADMLGMAALLLLFVMPVVCVWQAIAGRFERHHLLGFVAAFCIGIVARHLNYASWLLAERRDYRYDYDTREATWIANGQRQKLTNADLQNDLPS